MRAEADQAAPVIKQNKDRVGRIKTGRGFMIGNCILSEEYDSPAKSRARKTALRNVRLSEIESVVRYMFPEGVPDCSKTADLAVVKDFIRAYALSSGGDNVYEFAMRIAPWIQEDKFISSMSKMGGKRKFILSAQDCARLLCVTLDTRTELGLKTIGACDVSVEERKRLALEKKRLSDRERQAKKRRERGCLTRDEYDKRFESRDKPWIRMGVCRRTWFNRRARCIRGSQVASASGIANNLACDSAWQNRGMSHLLNQKKPLRFCKLPASEPIFSREEGRSYGPTLVSKGEPFVGFGATPRPVGDFRSNFGVAERIYG